MLEVYALVRSNTHDPIMLLPLVKLSAAEVPQYDLQVRLSVRLHASG